MLDNNDNTNIDKCEHSGDHSLPGFVCQRVATPGGMYWHHRGGVCTVTRVVCTYVLASTGSDVVVPRTLYTGAKGKLLDCHK